MEEVTVFEPHRLVVLLLFGKPDVLELLLEVEGVTHLIEEEG